MVGQRTGRGLSPCERTPNATFAVRQVAKKSDHSYMFAAARSSDADRNSWAIRLANGVDSDGDSSGITGQV